MPYVFCGHCTHSAPTQLLELPNLPMPFCSACRRIVCHLCRLNLATVGCRHTNYESATVVLSGSMTRQPVAAPSTLKTVKVDVGGSVITHAYSCPPGTDPPNSSDVLAIWSDAVGKSFARPMKSSTNGSGGGKVLSEDSQVFRLAEGRSGLTSYGAFDHFHVSLPGNALSSIERVWYYVDTTTTPVTIKFSRILKN